MFQFLVRPTNHSLLFKLSPLLVSENHPDPGTYFEEVFISIINKVNQVEEN
jgi:hypothetical protein